MTAHEVLSRMSSAALTDWMGYYQIEAEDQARAAQKAKAQSKLNRHKRI